MATSQLTVDFPLDPPTHIRVRLSQTNKNTFSSAFSTQPVIVNVNSEVEVAPVSAIRGAAPIAVSAGSLSFGILYTLERGSNPCSGGSVNCLEYGGIELGNGQISDYSNYLTNGYENILQAGDTVTMESQNINLTTWYALLSRINSAWSDSYTDFQPGSQRLIQVAVVSDTGLDTGKQVVINGWAAFFLEGCDYSGSITGRFVKYQGHGRIDPSVPDYGLRGTRLIK